MYQFDAAQQTITAKLPAFFQRFQTEKQVVKVNKSKITGENTFDGDHFATVANYDSNNGEENLF